MKRREGEREKERKREKRKREKIESGERGECLWLVIQACPGSTGLLLGDKGGMILFSEGASPWIVWYEIGVRYIGEHNTH